MSTTTRVGVGSRSAQSGLSLIELIIAIVVLSVGLVALLIPLTNATRTSGDPLVQKQMVAIAESMLEEIELQPFAGTFVGAPTQANRPQFDAVNDYDTFTTTGIFTIDGAPIPKLANYSISVSVQQTALGAIPANQSYLIAVTVSVPGSATSPVTVSAFRTAYY